MKSVSTIAQLQDMFDSDDGFRHFTVGRNAKGQYQAAYAQKNSLGYSTGLSFDLGEAIVEAMREYDSKAGYVIKGQRKSRRDDDDLI